MTSPYLPIFKFAGGKRKLASEIVSLFRPDFETYVEPFVGAGAVFLKLVELGAKKESRQFVLSDNDGDLVYLWTAIRDSPEDLYNQATSIVNASRFDEDRFLFLREIWNSDQRLPALNLVLRACTFNGLFRVSKWGNMNAPWNKTAPKIPSLDRLVSLSKILQDVEIRQAHFGHMTHVSTMVPRSVYYIDPPYLGGWTSYTQEGWSKADAILVTQRCHELTSAGAQVILSHSDTEEFREILTNHWPSLGKIHTIGAARSINSDGAGRGKVKEIVVIGNL